MHYDYDRHDFLNLKIFLLIHEILSHIFSYILLVNQSLNFIGFLFCLYKVDNVPLRFKIKNFY